MRPQKRSRAFALGTIPYANYALHGVEFAMQNITRHLAA
jgi:hypothetical protein